MKAYMQLPSDEYQPWSYLAPCQT